MATPIAIHLTLSDLTKATDNGLGTFDTPVQKVKGDARRYYDSVCLPLCKESWKERWQKMCMVLPAQGMDTDVTDEENANDSAQKEAEQLAEQWRRAPHFEHEEVTMTRLGEFKKIKLNRQLWALTKFSR